MLCNTGKYFWKIFFMLGNIGLFCVIKLHEVKKNHFSFRPSSFLCQNISRIFLILIGL